MVDGAWLHTGIHPAALLTLWVRGRLGVYLAATVSSHESAAHLQRAADKSWLAAFFVFLTMSYHLLMSILTIFF